MDYDQTNRQDALRCLSLADGKEIWRYSYPVSVKRFHGMSRTVPAVTDQVVVAIGPKCHVVCADALTGELKWGLDLVRQFGTRVPPWYAGQCPIIEDGVVILAPAGNTNLLMAVEVATGRTVWNSPNPHGWKMTHSSITPVEFEGQKMYVYCADKGVLAVSANTGQLLWDTTAWKISIANVPSPVALPGGRIFLSGGYNAGSMMLQLKKNGSQITAETAFKLGSEVFGATQHTPIFYEDHLFGVRPDGKFTCLDPAGKPVWVSGSGPGFGLGPFMIADGLIVALNDSGLLRLIEASPEKYTLLGQAQILKGRESWGPLALAGNRLIARDLTHMVCVDVGTNRSGS
jgi:outer membrane protein assembly factor BamB